MPVKVKVGTSSHPVLWKLVRLVLILVLVVVATGAIVFGIYYHQYKDVVQERLAQGPLFASVAQIYAAPQEIRPGQHLTAADIAASLRKAGYNSNTQLGSFQLREETRVGLQRYQSGDIRFFQQICGELADSRTHFQNLARQKT